MKILLLGMIIGFHDANTDKSFNTVWMFDSPVQFQAQIIRFTFILTNTVQEGKNIHKIEKKNHSISFCCLLFQFSTRRCICKPLGIIFTKFSFINTFSKRRKYSSSEIQTIYSSSSHRKELIVFVTLRIVPCKFPHRVSCLVS